MGFITSIQRSDGLKKAACLFAGLGHLQPLLLATTNSHYLLDRFCMERCCSSEYISRIVTSIIFMEILSILVVRLAIFIYIALRNSNWSDVTKLVGDTKTEEQIIGYISTGILFLIFLGYVQILYAFTTGGKKGHMHWFYVSLLIQHFLNSLIAGSIGFWEVGLALWYLATLPMAPITVFFYQLYIHSWIRNNGPRDAEYLVVEYQIWLALSISVLATIFWTAGYSISYAPATRLTIPTNLAQLDSQNNNNTITVTPAVTLKYITIQGNSSTSITLANSATKITLESGNSGTITIRVYSVTLNEAGASTSNTATIQYLKPATFTIKPGSEDGSSGQVTITLKAEVTGNPGGTLTVEPKEGVTIFSGPVTFENAGSAPGSGQQVNIKSVTLIHSHSDNISAPGATGVTVHTIVGRGCTPKHGYYIYGTSKTSTGNKVDTYLWNTRWDGGKCEFVECYYTGEKALLRFYVRVLGTLKIYYCGKESGNEWKTLSASETIDTKAEVKAAEFSKNFDQLVRGERLDSLGTSTPNTVYANKHNTNFSYVMFDPSEWNKWKLKNPTMTWAPLIMQGLSVGAVGSIFPNLIPKTLVCPKTTRTLSVMNMFLVTVPHIFNVMLGDMDLLSTIGVGDDWTKYKGWPCSLLLYLFYILAILFAIFNIHYPEWRLSSFLRNNTWMVFLMILFTDVLNETFNAISRAGICSQKSAVGTKKNHPCLHNKIACLMNLTYIIPWMTTTPMMKSYVSSLDPFLCDKDRDHWPTARYGRMKSFGYWCKCACRGLYNSPRKLIIHVSP